MTVTLGIANTWNAPINGQDSSDPDGSFTAMGAVSLTVPESFGVLHGGSLYAGFVSGKQSGVTPDQAARNSYYVGSTVPTVVDGLKLGVALDYMDLDGGNPTYNTSASSAVAGYLSFAATENVTLHGRVDYLQLGGDGLSPDGNLLGNPIFAPGDDLLATTITLDYRIWKNVISRFEFRWDHDLDEGGDAFRGGGATGHTDEMSLIANFIYKF